MKIEKPYPKQNISIQTMSVHLVNLLLWKILLMFTNGVESIFYSMQLMWSSEKCSHCELFYFNCACNIQKIIGYCYLQFYL